MSRRKSATKREILPDSKYNNPVVAKCINVVMWDGKKEVAEDIVYGALEMLKKSPKMVMSWRPFWRLLMR